MDFMTNVSANTVSNYGNVLSMYSIVFLLVRRNFFSFFGINMLASLLISIAAFFAWLNFIRPFVWPYSWSKNGNNWGEREK